MNPPVRIIFAALCTSVCHLTFAQSIAASADEPLKVMLQGGSSSELKSLVEKNGGSITHELHLISAVGAELSRSQLNQVLLSPLVERHLDDLSFREDPEGEKEQDGSPCDVGSALELHFNEQGVSWTFYNKLPAPASLARIELDWPRRLGPVSRISFGDQPVKQELYRHQKAGSLDLRFDGPSLPALQDKAELQIDFADFPATAETRPQQRELSIRAHFDGDCTSKLIPAYTDNAENFHYADVVGASALHQHGVTGKGVTVAVLDSGLWEHPRLANDSAGKPRVIARYNAINDIAGGEVFDESGHGTHMTSVLAHNGPVTQNGKPTGSFKGIAPDVQLVAVKAFSQTGQGEMLDIVRGVQWVVDNREKYGIRVLNLSFASRPRWNYWLDPVNQAVMRAWAAGITVVAAAGNEGPDAMTIGSPGNLPYVITVGALTDSWTPDDRNDDYIPDFSSRGPTPSAHIKPDIVAPGGHITGITRPGSTLIKDYPEYLLQSGDFVMSGSSQATALVSGIAALMLQLEPDLSPDDLKCKLLSSAEPAINSDGLLAYSPFQQGHGSINVTRAITLGERGCGNAELRIEREISGTEHFEGPAIVDSEGNPSLPGLERMLSPQPSEKGLSLSRKWGVKAHIERNDLPPTGSRQADGAPFDWYAIYQEEKAAIEALARQPDS